MGNTTLNTSTQQVKDQIKRALKSIRDSKSLMRESTALGDKTKLT